MKRFFSFFTIMGLVLTTFLSSNSYAIPLWDLKVGELRTYQGTDAIGNSWESQLRVTETISVGGETYFNIKQFNYHDNGETNQWTVRSTEDKIYAFDGSEEQLIWQVASIGTSWKPEVDQQNTIIDIKEITLPYEGGMNFDAYVIQNHEIVKNEYWYTYIVPGLGFVMEEDYWTDNAPKIEALSSIENTPVPEPGTIFLLGIGLLGVCFNKLRSNKK